MRISLLSNMLYLGVLTSVAASLTANFSRRGIQDSNGPKLRNTTILSERIGMRSTLGKDKSRFEHHGWGNSPLLCPGALIPAMKYMDAPEKSLSLNDGGSRIAANIARMVDHVYILCSDTEKCRSIRSKLPSIWPLENTSIFIGSIYDKCLFNESRFPGHSTVISLSHKAMILDAMEHDYASHMVLEEDFVFINNIEWPHCHVVAFREHMQSNDWWSIKLGWNMGAPIQCPIGCKCKRTHEAWCQVPPDSKCHFLIGLSHHYILSSRAYNAWLESINKIDVIGRSHKGMTILVPMLSVQAGRLTTHALESQKKFVASCVIGSGVDDIWLKI